MNLSTLTGKYEIKLYCDEGSNREVFSQRIKGFAKEYKQKWTNSSQTLSRDAT